MKTLNYQEMAKVEGGLLPVPDPNTCILDDFLIANDMNDLANDPTDAAAATLLWLDNQMAQRDGCLINA